MPSDNGASAAKTKGSSTPHWREAFDAVERPAASASESWLQSDTFMDGAALALRLRRRVNTELRRGLGAWLGAWNMATGSDVDRLTNQIASLERQVRDLRSELEQSGLPSLQIRNAVRRRPASRDSF